MMKALVVLASLTLNSLSAKAFPDFIRHHYVNCTACHVSPTGGGVLNAYGRAMSRELLSASGGEREAEFLHGLLPESTLQEWLQVGGHVRVLQIHRDSPERTSGRTIPMQAGLELAVQKQAWTAVAFVGQPDQKSRQIRGVSPRHYLMYSRDQLSLRGGRFLPAFGLNSPAHTLPTRQGLGFGANAERDGLEAVWSGEIWNLAAGASRSPQDRGRASDERLLNVQIHRQFQDSHRVGLSLLQGREPRQSREALSLHAQLGFSPRWAYLTEFAWQELRPQGASSTGGLFHFSQLLFEFKQGWQFFLSETYQKSNWKDSQTLIDSRGLGLRWYPRPHFELEAFASQERQASVADRYDVLGWLLLHYYF